MPYKLPNKPADYPEWREIIGSGQITTSQADELLTILHRYMAAKEMEKEAKDTLGDAKKPGLAKVLENKLVDWGLMKFAYMGVRFRVQAGQQRTIKKELLLANGVSLEAIEASTVESSFTFVVMEAGRT